MLLILVANCALAIPGRKHVSTNGELQPMIFILGLIKAIELGPWRAIYTDFFWDRADIAAAVYLMLYNAACMMGIMLYAQHRDYQTHDRDNLVGGVIVTCFFSVIAPIGYLS